MGLIDDLQGRRVYLDTNVFIYAVEGYESFAASLGQLFGAVAREEVQAVTSALTLAEALVWPYREGREDLANHYRSILQTRAGLTVLPLTRPVLIEAARLRAATTLKLPDALHLTTAVQHGCEVFLTNDGRIRLPDSMDVTVTLLSDVV